MIITAEYIGDNVLDSADHVTIGKEYTFITLGVVPGIIGAYVRGVLIDDNGALYAIQSHADDASVWKLSSVG